MQPTREFFMQDPDGSHSCRHNTQELPQNNLDDRCLPRECAATAAVNGRLPVPE